MDLELSINGVISSHTIAPNESLLTLLHREGYCSVKRGCETGECGACAVQVDGVPRPSCVMLAAQTGGSSITTVEKLGTSQKLHPLQAAFIEVGAVQCGFCTPGMLLSAHALLQRNPSPTESEVRDVISGNLCRCLGYKKPVQAILRAAAVLRHEKVPALSYPLTSAPDENTSLTGHLTALSGAGSKLRSSQSPASSAVTTKIPALALNVPIQASKQFDAQFQVVGKPAPTLNSVKLVTGKAAFVADSQPRGMLYGRLLSSPHAHAVIRNIDVSQAKALPGVQAVLTYKDVSRVPYTSVETASTDMRVLDQYSLDYIVRYVGDRVAAVAADTAEIAEQALRLIQIEYDVLPAILDPRQSFEPMASRIHPESESQGILDATRNIAARVRSDVGDVEQGFASSDLVVEGEYFIPASQTAPLENHTVVTYFDEDDFLVVRTSTQVPQHIRRTLAQILDLPLRRIRVLKPEVGGNFGFKQELVLEDICALLTLATQKMVSLSFSRANEFRSSRSQSQHVVRLKTGVMRDGTIVANQLMLLADTGAYATHSLITQTNAASALSLYPCAHMRLAAEVLYTNHAPVVAAPGSALYQEFFALESHLDEIALQLGLDALALRQKNWITTGANYPLLKDLARGKDLLARIESSGLATCLQIVEEKLQWTAKRNTMEEGRFRHGVGIALSLHGHPTAQMMVSGAMITLNEDGSFDIFASVNDGGNGSTTLVAQLVAEALGVTIDDVVLHTSDTSSLPADTGVNISSALYGSGGAVLKAAEQLRRQMLTIAGRMLNVLPEALKMSRGVISAPNNQQLTIGQVATYALHHEHRHLMTTASWKAQQTPTTFAAQGVEVEIDTETGSVRVLKVITAVDAGHVINPMIAEAQIEGSVSQALGLGISEELLYDQKGRLLTTDLSAYRIYTASDMPEMQTHLVTTRDPAGPLGAKSVAEIAFYGVVPALTNAVANAIGVRLRQIPLTPERVLRALHTQGAKKV